MITLDMRKAIIPILLIEDFTTRTITLKQYLSGFQKYFASHGTDYTYVASSIIRHGLK